jgi:xanthine dehydrogenase YagR molybdenum-binding subunit
MKIHTEDRKLGDAADGTMRLGQSFQRAEGALKVNGAATYAQDYVLENTVHAVLVQATIGAGEVLSIDATAANSRPGVLLIMTAETISPLNPATDPVGGPVRTEPYNPLARTVLYYGQQIAAVVAETREQAEEAASLLAITYREADVIANFHAANAGAGIAVTRADLDWGDAQGAFDAAEIRIEQTYQTPREYNVPLEPHAVVADWQGDQLTIHEPSQWVDGMARTYAEWFGLPFEKVRLISPYVGGGFGCKVFAMPHGAIAAMAARTIGRPVKLAVTRAQTFTAFGGRAATWQTLKLGADKTGKLVSILQTGASETAMDSIRLEQLNQATAVMWGVDNFHSRQNAVPVHTVLPGALRAPGKNPSAFGLECAMDELAYAINIDPLQLRLINEAEKNPQTGEPWSSRKMRDALAEGARAFGWDRRPMAPRSMRNGHELIGWGLACGTFPARHTPAEATIRILADGSAEVLSSAIDMGTGTYTVLAQVAADALGIAIDDITVRLGDSILPRAPIAGNSQIASLMAGVVHKASIAAKERLIEIALTAKGSAFAGLQANTLEVRDGRVSSAMASQETIPVYEILRSTGTEIIEVTRDTFPTDVSAADRYRSYTTTTGMQAPPNGGYSVYSWCAHFIEVRVDEDFGTVRVCRVVSALDCGRLYNPKLSESQWRGGIIMGIGQALLEAGNVDPRNGRVINNSLGDYLIATNADIPSIETISVGVPDYRASEMGGKPVGEISIVGVAAAISNAVFHATGKRFRRLPLNIAEILD